jgi:hypothetical protein
MTHFIVYVDYDLAEIQTAQVYAANAHEARVVAEFELLAEGRGGTVSAIEPRAVYV